MASPIQDIEMAIRALNSVAFFRTHYASGTKSVEAVQEIVSVLLVQGELEKRGRFGGLLTNLADAISKAYLDRPAFLPTKEQLEYSNQILGTEKTPNEGD